MTERLKTLYKSVILKHNNEPLHFAKNESATEVVKANSPVCGDRFTVYFDIEEGRVTNLSFYGHGCAVSKASTSILCEKLSDLPLESALEVCQHFFAHLPTESDLKDQLEEFEAFSAVQYFPGRRQCAVLCWEEMQKKLINYRRQ